jgi:formylglycine-generating enzyme required for sulfatase activity
VSLVGCHRSAAELKPGAQFQDCSNDCPLMIVIPAGRFLMGSPPAEAGRFDDEGPQHDVTIAQPLAVSRAPITRSEYERFVRASHRQDSDGCASMDNDGRWVKTTGLSWRKPGFQQTGDHPVICVSWDDALAYAQWLSARSGHAYRLLSEAEFEYVARAGATTAFPWGASAQDICTHANSFDAAARRDHPDWPGADCDDGHAATSPANAFPANGFGLYGTTGNVFQWTADCFVEGGYSDAAAAESKGQATTCAQRVIRGGSWLNGWRGLRAAMRDRDPPQGRYTNIGIRVARVL